MAALSVPQVIRQAQKQVLEALATETQQEGSK